MELIKKYKNQILGFLFVLTVMVVVFFVSGLLQDKSVYKCKDFISEENSFDVLFFGSCHPEIAISPMELWNDYGMTSYNFGNGSEPVKMTYWVMANAIDVHKPKIAVLDVSSFNPNRDSVVDNSVVHYCLDAFPLSDVKMNAVNDLVKDNSTKLEYIFNIGYSHSRWEELKEDDVTDNTRFMKGNLSYGFYHTMEVKQFEQYPLTDDVADFNDSDNDVIYLNRIIDLCKENDVELLFINVPYICKQERQAYGNAAGAIAKENNIPYLDMFRLNKPVIDFDIDTYDGQHVNQSGTHKVTELIGKYLKENYEIEDHRSDPAYDAWNKSHDDYMTLKYESMWWCESIETELMLLRDDDVYAYAYINKSIDLLNTPIINKLMDNASDVRQISIEEICRRADICVEDTSEINSSDACIIFVDKKTDIIKLIKAYSVNEEGIIENTVYSGIKGKYMFKQ